jgi:hypothetical protein
MKPCAKDADWDLDGLGKSLKGLVHAQLELSDAVLKLLSTGASGAWDEMRGMGMPAWGSCCDIPEPCWMPRCAGDAVCRLAPGDTGELRLLITNADYVSHHYHLHAAGSGAADVTFPVTTFTLTPKERRLVKVFFTMPASPPPQGGPYDVVIWVRGCREHYVRWTLHEATKSLHCCHETCIEDAPDYIVRWYDHFYCKRSCPGSLGGKI